MKISGYKNDKDFYKYIRVRPEEAAQKIKELGQGKRISCNNNGFSYIQPQREFDIRTDVLFANRRIIIQS